jgi:hypothetical protein
MARPKKENADYFPHDADMRNDNKIKALRRKYGLKGYAIWCMLLEHLTDCNGFDYQITDINIELMAGDFDIDPIELKEIINYLTTLNLLENDCDFIYSNNLIKRFESVLSRRKTQRKVVIDVDNPLNDTVIDVDNPQSKVKESKVKESKGNSLLKEKGNFNFLDELFNDSQWQEDICRLNKIDSEKLLKYLDIFDLSLKSKLIKFTNKKEYANYFTNWISIEIKKEKENTLKNGKNIKRSGAAEFLAQFE